ncbi:histidine phosphatase family protein [Lacticigenium naphthae]|uniref:histidine phosphatase family protein n=1 Tax=Lacticigenium naphthae TaxID=515351 RepID=UPI00040A3BD4|nr:histidine phosphatase family protein [Lacticigenium naphthae]
MSKIFFVRHGKTEFNAAKKVQGGSVDSPLLLESIVEAKKTGIRLKKENLRYVFVSPQIRALDTARHITEAFTHIHELQTVDEWKEMHYGTWEGKYMPDLEVDYPQLFHHLRNQPEKYDPRTIQAETYESLASRGVTAIQKAQEQFPNENLLFVGHSITTTCTMLSLLGKPISAFRSFEPLDNTSISILHFDNDHYSVDTWNDTSHLN